MANTRDTVGAHGAPRSRGRPSRDAIPARGQIIACAREVFTERGYGGLTFQDVADRLKLTRPAVHHHFRNRRLLFAAVLDASLDAIQDDAARASTHPTFHARFTALFDDPTTAAALRFLLVASVECRRHRDLHGSADHPRLHTLFRATLRHCLTPPRADRDPDTATIQTGVLLLCAAAFATEPTSDTTNASTPTTALIGDLIAALGQCQT